MLFSILSQNAYTIFLVSKEMKHYYFHFLSKTKNSSHLVVFVFSRHHKEIVRDTLIISRQQHYDDNSGQKYKCFANLRTWWHFCILCIAFVLHSIYYAKQSKQFSSFFLPFVRNAVRNISRIFDERLFINFVCVIVVVEVHYNELDSISVSIPSNSHRDQKAINLCCFYKYRNKFSLCLKFVVYISTICFRFLIITIYCCLVGKQVNFSNIIVTIYN